MLGHHSAAVRLRHYKQAIPERQRVAVEDLERRLRQNPEDSVRNCTSPEHGEAVNIGLQ